ncbi:hypothetical protein PMG11_09434 [Penicillium brasilianum]|uniref:NACHT domain-containing protein n=1 Tax=Penicillium brasilianum TaxID=104259 RepID=A0A0F7TZK1_PENBI|nr:hypothetical protein PMG11_09434 [Penicillium brasilianum]
MGSRSSASFDGSTNLGGFQNGINNGTINVFKEDGDNECLSALLSTHPRVSDPGAHIRKIEEEKGGLLKDSYEWMIHHPSFRQIQFDDQKRLLWIRGEPGHGKTMLLMGMIKELDDSSPRAGLAYFFCQGTDEEMNSATAVLRGLIYRLILIKPSLITHLRKIYDCHKGVFQDRSSFFALPDIAGGMLEDPKLGRAFIVIDALDERNKSGSATQIHSYEYLGITFREVDCVESQRPSHH